MIRPQNDLLEVHQQTVEFIGPQIPARESVNCVQLLASVAEESPSLARHREEKSSEFCYGTQRAPRLLIV